MANAFGALGADGASIGINPAGLGLYRITELSITPALEVNEARSTYYGSKATDSRTQFHVNNFLLAIHNPNTKGSNWRSGTFGVAFDRQETYHWNRQAMGDPVPSTILEDFAQVANGTPEADLFTQFPFTSALAWDTYGIDPLDTLANTYASAIPFGSHTRQQHTIESRGALSNTAFFYSGSYLDKVYLGASLGIVNQRYKHTTVHRETSLDTNLDLRDATYTEDLNTSGGGVDLKVGLIVRLNDRLRIGAAYHSPQGLQINDAFTRSMVTNFRSPDANGRTSYSSASPDGYFSYRLRTPWRMVFSAAYVAGPNGLVSVDYTYTDPRKMEFRSDDLGVYDFATENAAINSSFQQVHSVRAGTEWRHGNWYYRLGWGFVGNAYRDGDARHGQAMLTYAGGVGYRTDHIGIDLGLNYVSRSVVFFQYDPALVDATREERRSYRTLVTFSLRP